MEVTHVEGSLRDFIGIRNEVSKRNWVVDDKHLEHLNTERE